MSGFTNVPNQLWDWMIDNKQLSKQTRILAMVIRYTICFKREYHELSLQFISNRIGMIKNNVSRELNSMIENGLIREKVEKGNRYLAIGNQIDLENVVIKSDNYGVIKNDNSNDEGVIKSDNWGVIKNDNSEVIKSDNQEIKQSKLKNNTNVQFEEFFMKYPRKQAKKDAERAFEQAIEKEPFETIMQGLDGYLIKIKEEKTEMRFIKLPAGWLEDERWIDTLHIKPNESHIHRIIQANQHINGDQDERLRRAFNERRKQAGFV